MIYTVRIPSWGNPAVESFLDREHFVQTMFERSGAWYAIITREEFLQRFLNEEEAREHCPEAWSLFDAGHSELAEYTTSVADGSPEYIPLSSRGRPSRKDVAYLILAHDLHSAYLLDQDRAEDFTTAYDGHKSLEARRALRSLLEQVTE